MIAMIKDKIEDAKVKLEKFIDKSMLVEDLYVELMDADILKLHNAFSFYTIGNIHDKGVNYRNELYTCRRVLKDRHIVLEEFHKAVEAAMVTQQLIGDVKK